MHNLTSLDDLMPDKFEKILNAINTSAPLKIYICNSYETAGDINLIRNRGNRKKN